LIEEKEVVARNVTNVMRKVISLVIALKERVVTVEDMVERDVKVVEIVTIVVSQVIWPETVNKIVVKEVLEEEDNMEEKDVLVVVIVLATIVVRLVISPRIAPNKEEVVDRDVEVIVVVTVVDTVKTVVVIVVEIVIFHATTVVRRVTCPVNAPRNVSKVVSVVKEEKEVVESVTTVTKKDISPETVPPKSEELFYKVFI